LLGLDQTAEGREMLQKAEKTRKFDLLPPESEAALSMMKELMRLVPRGQ
jgi:hypothetical protein